MRLAPPRLAVPVVMLTLAVAGCGGSQVAVQEVPGDDPVSLSVPGSGAALAPAATASATPTATETPEAGAAQATATPDGTSNGDGTAQSAPEGTTGGGTAAPDGEDNAATDQPPPAGSDAQQFEDFCAENPGAC
jgi:hypothetical protein